MEKNNSVRARRILEKAESEGRNFLLEPEVYALLKLFGFKVPSHIFLKSGEKLKADSLKRIKSKEAVVKVVSPLIQHKSDVGGVALVKNSRREIELAMKEMKKRVGTAVARLDK
ncbi:MAG TPA: acetate--CoA ligase family protein, partial [Candidatus Saccharicenans sp.]|nr:acetate--CoA ligase family protein [Candidatus Saccharicenans sp.]